MSLSVIRPLTMAELLTDPIYKKYLLTAPKLTVPTENPFRVWGLRDDDKWAGKLFPDYRSGFELVKKMLKDPKYVDVAIICRPKGFGPPPGFAVPPLMQWCGYCRRPSVFRRSSRHHATRGWPVVDPDTSIRRCYYCASRESAHRWR